jgi:hypothetical protein
MHAYGSNCDDGGPCNDGGASTEFSDCPCGTDCADCAPRAQPPQLLLYKTSELRSGSTGKLVRYIGKRARPTVEEAAHVVGDGSGVRSLESEIDSWAQESSPERDDSVRHHPELEGARGHPELEGARGRNSN